MGRTERLTHSLFESKKGGVMTAPAHSTNQPTADGSVPLSEDARILAIDIGGSGLKASIINTDGEMVTDRVRVKTPRLRKPERLVDEIVKLVEPLTDYAVVSVGFPGVVRNGKILTAPNLGTKKLRGFDLAGALESKIARPVRVLNDADMQGLGAIQGNGVEMVLTLGTGFGSALFVEGQIAPHLEISHVPFRKGDTYDEQLGNKAYEKIGKKKWNRRVRKAIENMRTLTNFDRLYIGGGNADKINFKLGEDVQIIPNECGLKGGAWLWQNRNRDGEQ
jgi:polyphosphate glucokinase